MLAAGMYFLNLIIVINIDGHSYFYSWINNIYIPKSLNLTL